jgi:[ribosomal protein S5]-alanine N-acetyltransferase
VPFPLVTSIRAARLTLRPLAEGDLPDLLEMSGDEQVTRFLPYAPWRSLDDGRAWFARMAALGSAGTAQQLVLAAHHGGRVIGSLLLFNHHEGSSRIELGYALRRSQWGRGLMREAAGAACSHAFAAGVRRIEAEVNPANAASCALLARLGFTLEGTLRQRWVNHGAANDTNMYACLAGEWPPALTAREFP